VQLGDSRLDPEDRCLVGVPGQTGRRRRFPHGVGLFQANASCSATSSALGINLKQIGSLAAVVTGVQLPLTLLSGALLPLSLGPAWLRVLGHLNPMYYAVQAARDLAVGTITTVDVGIGFLVTVAAAALALWWGTRSYRKAMV
jgi:ABC-2 type transport system permease protein